jgi:hypothetical protein
MATAIAGGGGPDRPRTLEEETSGIVKAIRRDVAYIRTGVDDIRSRLFGAAADDTVVVPRYLVPSTTKERVLIMADTAKSKDTGSSFGGFIGACIVAAVLLLVAWISIEGITAAVRGRPLIVTSPTPQQAVVYAQPSVASVAPSSHVSGGSVGIVGASRAPSPAQIANMVPHTTTRVCVPCVDGYAQNPQTCDCTKVTWHPGPPPQ